MELPERVRKQGVRPLSDPDSLPALQGGAKQEDGTRWSSSIKKPDHDKDRLVERRSYWFSGLANMKTFFAFIILLVLFLNSCAALRDAKFTTRDGKESPFKVETDPYAAPRDPTDRR